MLYRENEILILDEPTAVLTPQEIDELMKVMKDLVAEGKSIIFITHKLNEILQAADRCTVLRRGKMVGVVDVASITKEELSEMMVGRKVELNVEKKDAHPGETILSVRGLVVKSKRHGSQKNVVNHVSFSVKRGEIVCIAGIEGNGQSELVYGITGLAPISGGHILLNGKDITKASVRKRSVSGMSHIPEDRHKHGLVLDYNLQQNAVLQTYFEPRFQNHGMIKFGAVREYAKGLIKQYDIRSGQGEDSTVRDKSGGNQQKVIVARELDRNPNIVIAVQPTRGLDIGATEYIHKQLLAQRDSGKGVLLVSLELDEVMEVSDRILVIFEGEIVGDLDPKEITVQELGLYMSGSKRSVKHEKEA
jgi:simple sugar transport system ATP-binding protein